MTNIIYCDLKMPKFKDQDKKFLDGVNKEVDKPLKLHLGCFNKPLHGWLNIDIRTEGTKADIFDDAFKLERFENNSVDTILAVHLLEHNDRAGADSALKRWFEILKPGGRVFISVPDLDIIFRDYIYYNDMRRLQCFLYGSQRHKYDWHLVGFNEKTLTEDLTKVGFKNIKRYDWKEQEWAYVDSYEKAYHPYKQFDTGVLMSLNLVAEK